MKNKILIVDDQELNQDILEAILEEDYSILKADNGQEALEVIEREQGHLRLVLLDLIMPVMDGFGVLERMKEMGLIGQLPVIVISGETDSAAQVRSFRMGVSDFIQKPFDEDIVRHRVRNVADLFDYRNSLEEKVEVQTQQIRERNEQLQLQAKHLREVNVKIIDILGNVVESRNLESGEHVKRVKGFARLLGLQLMKDFPQYGLTEETVNMISEASALHDIGKISIPDNVLLKPGRLTDEEFAMMKTHTTKGCILLDHIEGIWENEDYRRFSYEICRSHHERFDGRGYPDGLKGDEIPLAARIVSVADVYDALVSERCYKKAFSKDEAFRMITGGKCGTFAPELMESFRNARAEFEALADSGKKS